MKVKNEGDLCSRHNYKKDKCIYFGNIEIDKKLIKDDTLKTLNQKITLEKEIQLLNPSNSTLNGDISLHIPETKKEILIGNNLINNNDKNKQEPLIFNKLSKDELSYCLKNGVKIYNETSPTINYYGLNNKKINVEKFLKIYNDNKKIEKYIKNNNKYLYLKNNNKNKSFYYKEIDVNNLLEYINIKFEILLEDIINYGKNNYYSLLTEYKDDIDLSIKEFHEIDDNYKLYI